MTRDQFLQQVNVWLLVAGKTFQVTHEQIGAAIEHAQWGPEAHAGPTAVAGLMISRQRAGLL